MRGSQLREALVSGERVYGIGLEGFGQPKWPSLLARCGLDFVFMDTEHTPINRETAAWAAQAYAAHGVAPLLRIPEISASQAAMGLDLGAHGIIVPYVETVEDVRALVGAVRYRPLKGAALRQAVERGVFPSAETAAYLPQYNRDAVLIIMIESPTGVASLPDLLAVGGIDAVLVGPHDLSIGLGIPEQYDHPTFEQTARRIIEVCRQHQTGVGLFSAGPLERTLRWAGWGCNLIIHRADTLFVASGIEHELQRIKQSLAG